MIKNLFSFVTFSFAQSRNIIRSDAIFQFTHRVSSFTLSWRPWPRCGGQMMRPWAALRLPCQWWDRLGQHLTWHCVNYWSNCYKTLLCYTNFKCYITWDSATITRLSFTWCQRWPNSAVGLWNWVFLWTFFTPLMKHRLLTLCHITCIYVPIYTEINGLVINTSVWLLQLQD